MRPHGWLLLLLAGCAALGPADEAAIVSEAVALAVATARAPGDVRHHELDRAVREFERGPDRVPRARLAILLATLPEPERDDARAAMLLEPLAAQQPESDLSRFARLLAAIVAERQQHAREAGAAEQRADALRKQLELTRRDARAGEHREEALRRQIEAYKRDARAGEQREETLRKQIQALREAERSMLEHEERLPVKPR